MPSLYILPSEYVDFDLQGADNAKVRSASAIIDGYLRRPEGLAWLPDYSGAPCYMAAKSPTITFTLPSAISPGANVTVPINSGLSLTGAVGDVAIIDRPTLPKSQGVSPTNICEACVVASVTKTSITFANVAQAHAQGTAVEFGLVLSEQKSLPSKRSIARLAHWPIVRLISGLGSYRYGRRSDQEAGLYADQSVLALMQTFGGPPEWTSFDVTAADFNPITNEVWIPSGIFLAYYSDVRLFYVAGYAQSAVPWPIKNATAMVINAGLVQAELGGGIKMAKAGDSAIERFENTVLDDDMRRQLAPFKARLLY